MNPSTADSAASLSSPPLRRRAALWWALWFLWLAVLWVLSSMSHPGPQVDIAGFDKVEHTLWFAGGGASLALALSFHRRPQVALLAALRDRSQTPPSSSTDPAATQGKNPLSPPWGRILLFVVITGALVGGVDEWHQSHTPGRSGLDVYDWMADVLGSLLAVPAARLTRRIL